MKSVVVFKFIVMFFLVLHLSKEGSSSGSDVNDCYTFHDVDSTWIEARDACREMGAHLVTMETTEESNKVRRFIVEKTKQPDSYTHYYVGLRKVKGTWTWTEAGSPGVTLATDDSQWKRGQPTGDRDPREQCGEIWYPRTGVKGLNDIMCDAKVGAKRGYICENY